MRKTLSCACAVLALLAAAASAQDAGLTAPSNALGGAIWQTRVERDSLLLTPMPGTLALNLPAVQSLRLLGDYQLSSLRLGDTGGLRLTGGVLINLRTVSGAMPTSAASIDGSSALPYAGVGYTSGSARGEWGFSADLGLAAQGLSSLRLDRLFNGAGGGPDTGFKLQPMIRLGMSVAF